MSCDLERKPVCHFQTRYLHIISFLFTFTKRNITSASLACAGQKEDSVDRAKSVSCDFGKETPVSFSYKLLTYHISFLLTFIKRYVTSASLACAGQKEDSVDTLFPTAKVICTMPLYKYATKFQ